MDTNYYFFPLKTPIGEIEDCILVRHLKTRRLKKQPLNQRTKDKADG